MKIMIFLHGTAIMHKGAVGLDRIKRVNQSRQRREASIGDFESYVPIGNVVEKLKKWNDQGAEIIYLSSHRNPRDVEKDKHVLERFDFPGGRILFRKEGKSYGDAMAESLPDILIEDDCESIGGEAQMAHPQMSSEAKKGVKSIVVREFGGIDHLPDDIRALKEWNAA